MSLNTPSFEYYGFAYPLFGYSMHFILLFYAECEFGFIACVEEQITKEAKNSADAFRHCIENVNLFTSLGCEETCAPTSNMLFWSQSPSTAIIVNFGAGQDTPNPRPDTSRCIAP